MKTRHALFSLSALFGAVFLSTAQPIDIRHGLVAYWPLEETPDGLITSDLSPFGNHLNLLNMDASNFVPGRHGNAAAFNGTDELLNRVYLLGEDNGLPVYNARRYTVMLWVNGVGATQGGTGAGDRRVFSEGSTTANAPLFNIGTDSAAVATRTNVVDMYIRTDANTAVVSHRKSARMAFDGTWHHIAWVDEEGTARLYIDGELDTTVFNYTRGTLTLNTISVGGIQRAAPGNYYTGLIDDVAIWERPLTQSEIQEIMTNSMQTPIPEFPPVFITQPVGGTRGVGDRITLTGRAVGTRPLNYQWFKNGAEILGATSSSLTLVNLTPLDSGDYTLQASNSEGTIPSSAATVTVPIDPTPDVRQGLISYWPMDVITEDESFTQSTPDLYSGNDISLVTGIWDTPPGAFGTSILFSGTDQYGVRKSGFPIYNSPAFTVALWVNASGIGQNDRKFFAESSTNNSNPVFAFGTHTNGADGTIRVFVRNDANGTLLSRNSTRTALDGTWHHLAWVETNGQAKLYIDGVLDETDFNYVRGTLTLNQTVFGALRTTLNEFFAGSLDDIAVWNRMLTFTEIQEIRTNGIPPPEMILLPVITRQPADVSDFAGETLMLSVDATGTQPLYFQWRRNGMDIPDETNSFIILANAQTSDAGVYSVVVTNAGGTTASSNAIVTVESIENITAGLVAYWPLDVITSISPDTTSNGNDLLPVNIDASNLVPGRFGNAVQFNGTDELLVNYHTNGFGLPIYHWPKHTVALWVNGIGNMQPSTPNNGDRRVFSEGSTVNNATLLNIGTDNANGSLSADIFIRDDANAAQVSHRKSAVQAFDGAWHHLAWVDNNGVAQLYVDGVLDTTDFNYTRTPLTLNTTSIGGIVRAAHSHWFLGLIDDVALWRRALSEEEIQYVIANRPVLPAAVVITQIEVMGGNIVLTIATANPGANQRVEERSDLGTSMWTEVQNVTFSGPLGNAITATFAVPAANQRFYRVVEVQ